MSSTTTNLAMSMLLLCFLFIPIYSIPAQINERSRYSPLNRQKRTFGLGLFGSRDWPSFHKTLRLPTFSTIPTFLHFFDEEELYGNLMKKISDLEIGQERIINYFQQLNANKNANPCETTSTSTIKPSLANVPEPDVDILYREPMTIATSTADATITSSGSSGGSSSSSSIITTTTTSQEAVTEPATELSSVETSAETSAGTSAGTSAETSIETSKDEDEEIAELDVATVPPALEDLMRVHDDDMTEKNEVL